GEDRHARGRCGREAWRAGRREEEVRANHRSTGVSSGPMPQSFYLVDAFTAEPFAGNPAAVYVLDEWPGDGWLQRVAREMNQSETAFLVPEGTAFHLRWFTPLIEVELCGHATLASAHVLWSMGAAELSQPIAFRTRSGP